MSEVAEVKTFPLYEGWSTRNQKSSEAIAGAVGKRIDRISVDGDRLDIQFRDGARLLMRDDGQSCCEHRYMTVDGDDLTSYQGATFLGADLSDAPDVVDDGDVHEVQFLNIRTSYGVLAVANHNEHNGYYGGFAIVAEGMAA